MIKKYQNKIFKNDKSPYNSPETACHEMLVDVKLVTG